MYWYGGHMSGWGYGFGIFSMILFWGLLIVGVMVLLRYLSRGASPEPPAQHHPAQPPSAEQILAERFARGEIDADEYRSRLDILHDHPHPSAAP